MNANLVLREITLHGIGSYLNGTRLQLSPLTILCGTNGSGKSTWLKVLNTLKDSLQNCEGFPFKLNSIDENVGDINFTNAKVFFQLFDDQCESYHADTSIEGPFGPITTVGLLLEAANDFELSRIEWDYSVPPLGIQELFWGGKCEKGTKLNLRIAHPGYEPGTECEGVRHLVELRIDEAYVVRFLGVDGVGGKSANHYSVTVSSALLPSVSTDDDTRLMEIATYDPYRNQVSVVEGILDTDEATKVIDTAIRRINELFRMALKGYFYISAIRQPFSFSRLEEARKSSQDDDLLQERENVAIQSRYTGTQGEFTWFLEREYALNMMLAESQVEWGKVIGALRFEGYVSKWSELLLDTKVVVDENDVESEVFSKGVPDKPTAFLESETPDKTATSEWAHYNSEDSLDKLKHPCFHAQPQSPRQMSSGFHQLVPLIVQSGLMRRYEIMAVENPEVHLHPGLQLRLAEFLLEQAKAGKWIVIETHSDLIIRRILRAILEEEISQEKLRIYFTDIDKSDDNYYFSTLNAIEIDERGRIKNWPRGFMDDDTNESQRLLDIMYGSPTDGMEE